MRVLASDDNVCLAAKGGCPGPDVQATPSAPAGKAKKSPAKRGFFNITLAGTQVFLAAPLGAAVPAEPNEPMKRSNEPSATLNQSA